MNSKRKWNYIFGCSCAKSLLDTVCKNVEFSSPIFTDEYRGYDQLEEHGLTHKNMMHSQKEYANGIAHVNSCECRSNLYKMDKKIHWCKQVQFTNIFQNILVYS